MLQVIYRAEGAGLVAPQVGIAKGFFVYDCQGQKGVIANPIIVDRSRVLSRR
jgi:peptide deformylase